MFTWLTETTNQHPGVNNDATWELVNFIVGEGYMEHVDETLRTTLNHVVSRLHQDDVSPKRLRQEGLAVQGLNACKAQLAGEGSVSSSVRSSRALAAKERVKLELAGKRNKEKMAAVSGRKNEMKDKEKRKANNYLRNEIAGGSGW